MGGLSLADAFRVLAAPRLVEADNAVDQFAATGGGGCLAYRAPEVEGPARRTAAADEDCGEEAHGPGGRSVRRRWVLLAFQISRRFGFVELAAFGDAAVDGAGPSAVGLFAGWRRGCGTSAGHLAAARSPRARRRLPRLCWYNPTVASTGPTSRIRISRAMRR